MQDVASAESILNFLHVRPVRLSSLPSITFAAFDAAKKSPFHKEIADIPESPTRRDEAVSKAEAFLKDEARYLHSAPKLLIEAAKELSEDSQKIDQLSTMLGKPLKDWLVDPKVQELRTRLWDSLYAQVLSPFSKPEDRAGIYLGIRSFHFLETALEKAPWPRMAWTKIQEVRALVPPDLVPRAASSIDADMEQKQADGLASLQVILEDVKALQFSARELRSKDKIYNQAATTPAATAAPPPGPTTTPGTSPPTPGPAPAPTPGPKPTPTSPGAGTGTAPGGVTIIVNPTGEQPPAAAPVEPCDMVTVSSVLSKSWVYDDNGDASGTLDPSTQAILNSRKVDFLNKEAPEIAGVFELESEVKADSFWKSLDPRIIPFVVRTDEFQELEELVPLPNGPAELYGPEPAPGSPQARGLRPLGIGDLLVVKQLLWKYEPGEVAHVENVLAHEYRNRSHTRVQETEETLITEVERLEETERDSQSTERFELQREVQQTVDSYTKLDAGVNVTASYGAVTFGAHADFALGQSSSDSNRSASDFAKEITERSVSKLTERKREERTRRTLQRTEEKNEHGFDNKAGASNITGIYRWVDKFYKARIINRGKRLMMEFMIPEPAAFYLYALANPAPDARDPVRPESPSYKPPKLSARELRPGDLSRYNYQEYVAKYGAQGVEAYPAETVRVSTGLAGTAAGEDQNEYATKDSSLAVPSGYSADRIVSWYTHVLFKEGKKSIFKVLIAGADIQDASVFGLEGSIPISVTGWGRGYNVSIKVVCSLLDKGRETWRIKTYQAIMEGYQRQLSDWRDQIAVREIRTGVQIEGRNPTFNRKIEQDELRKAALRLLTNEFAQTKVSGVWRSNEQFNAMQVGHNGYPELNPFESIVEGKIIQFFEQAFEWSNMTYRFLPYFWGRKDNWVKNYPLSDPDPMFIDFLRSGFARVVVPVNPAYTETVLHYLYTNEIWNGGEPPTLNDPLFVSIVDEIKNDNDADLNGAPICSMDSLQYPCIVEEFDIKLPTTLVWLQPNDSLPHFEIDPLPEQPAPPSKTEITLKLEARAKQIGATNWRKSVVDLCKVLGLPITFQYRRRLAQRLSCPASILSGKSFDLNVWLHARLLQLAYDNNGSVPVDLTANT